MAYGIVFDVIYHHLLVALTQRVGHRVAQTRVILVSHFQLVDDDLYRVVLVAVELHPRLYFPYMPVSAHRHVSLLLKLLEKLLVMSLAVVHHWSQKHDLAPGISVEYEVDNLLVAVFHHRLA